MRTFWEETVSSPEDFITTVQKISPWVKSHPLILLFGEPGSGKTTLTQFLSRKIDTLDQVSSPTFSMVNTYICKTGEWYHFDLYRLSEEAELMDMGFWDYIASGNLCVIEWPELAMPFLESEPHIRIYLKYNDSGSRSLTAEIIN
jgi:tRNA threonylcarbamoyladenosine biosynthesis protein TsaE